MNSHQTQGSFTSDHVKIFPRNDGSFVVVTPLFTTLVEKGDLVSNIVATDDKICFEDDPRIVFERFHLSQAFPSVSTRLTEYQHCTYFANLKLIAHERFVDPSEDDDANPNDYDCTVTDDDEDDNTDADTDMDCEAVKCEGEREQGVKTEHTESE